MKLENQFKFAAILVLIVMIFVAIIPFRTSLSTQATMAVRQTALLKEEKYGRLLDLLRDAEAAQRGFIITGDENFLGTYYSAIAEIPPLLKFMTEEFNETPEEKKTIQEIFRLIDLKFAELAETITVRRTKGFAAAEPIVSSQRGKKYMDSLRVLIGKEEDKSRSQRKSLLEKLQHQTDVAFAVGAVATLVNLSILTLLMISMFRLLKSRHEAAGMLEAASNELTKSIAEVELRNREMEVSAEMLQALDSMSTLEETSKIIATYCGKLLPDLPGALFLYRNSRDQLEAQTTWGALHLSVAQLEPRDCWALQRGRAHYTSSAHDLCCSHYAHNPEAPSGRLCVPLVTQGEVIGLLYFEGLSTQDNVLKFQQHLIDRIAEQIALALSNVRLRETLRRQSIVDPLTGLFNRRYMDETLKRELSRAERKGMPLAVIMLDLDHFKRMNDTFGHDAGDAILKNVAQEIRANIRESDLACRFGGEELTVILPECDAEAAFARAEKIRNAIASIDIQHGGRQLGGATASFGVAVFPAHGRDPEALLHAADQALYRAKQAGRNQVLAAVN